MSFLPSIFRKSERFRMNANELADELDSISYDCSLEEWRASPIGNAAAMLRQLQTENESLKKSCLDEIFKRTYADRAAEVICEYWMESQSEIKALLKFIDERAETGQLIIWQSKQK